MKRGQIGGGGAAALIAVIAIIIVLYIALLPAEERQALLYGEDADEEDADGEVLLLEHPGRLEYLDQDKIEHSIPSMNLYSKTEATIFKKLDSVYVSKWLVGGKKETINFTISDLANTRSILLGYNIKDGSGRLIIKLNDHQILNKEIRTTTPLQLQKEFLKEGSNSLIITCSNPGIALWKTNKYTLGNLIITGDFTDISGLTAYSSFIVSASEKNSLKRVTLKFLPVCDEDTTEKLEILINDNSIYSAIPDCGLARPIEFSPSFIKNGENIVTFKADSGDIIIDHVMITSQLKEFVYPIYHFNLDEDLYDDIKDNTKDLELELKFFDNVAFKSAKILVNSEELYVAGKEQKFTKDISNYIIEGSNSIRIEPAVSIDVLDLTVKVK